MDPVSIGIAVAALLGGKAVEGFAKEAGTEAWHIVHRLATSVRTRLSPRGREALDRLGTGASEAEAQAVVADEVTASARTDPAFRAELEALVAQAGRHERLASVLAVAHDNAKQVNIGGDNSGAITL